MKFIAFDKNFSDYSFDSKNYKIHLRQMLPSLPSAMSAFFGKTCIHDECLGAAIQYNNRSTASDILGRMSQNTTW